MHCCGLVVALSVVITCVRACRKAGLVLGHADQRDQVAAAMATELGRAHPWFQRH